MTRGAQHKKLLTYGRVVWSIKKNRWLTFKGGGKMRLVKILILFLF